jgi:hypothetical protein
VIFPADLSPEDFARGYVASEVVTSSETGATRDNPLNINQSANISPNTASANPDLRQDLKSVERQSEVWLVFRCDQPLTDDDIVQNTSGLRVYFPRAPEGGNTIPEACAIEVKLVDEQTLRARFRDLPGDYRPRYAVGRSSPRARCREPRATARTTVTTRPTRRSSTSTGPDRAEPVQRPGHGSPLVPIGTMLPESCLVDQDRTCSRRCPEWLMS